MWKALRKAARFANWSARVPANPTASLVPMTTATLQTTTMDQITAMGQTTAMTTITPLIPTPITPLGR